MTPDSPILDDGEHLESIERETLDSISDEPRALGKSVQSLPVILSNYGWVGLIGLGRSVQAKDVKIRDVKIGPLGGVNQLSFPEHTSSESVPKARISTSETIQPIKICQIF